jgi:hypothetical protein
MHLRAAPAELRLSRVQYELLVAPRRHGCCFAVASNRHASGIASICVPGKHPAPAPHQSLGFTCSPARVSCSRSSVARRGRPRACACAAIFAYRTLAPAIAVAARFFTERSQTGTRRLMLTPTTGLPALSAQMWKICIGEPKQKLKGRRPGSCVHSKVLCRSCTGPSPTHPQSDAGA